MNFKGMIKMAPRCGKDEPGNDCGATKFGRLIFGAQLPRFDEQRFLDSCLGGGGEASLEDEARSFVQSSEDLDALIHCFGDEYEWHQGFQEGIAEVMSTLAEVCKGIKISRKGTVWPPEPPPPEIELVIPAETVIHLEIEYFDPPFPQELRAVLAQLGLSQRAAARLLGVNGRAVSAWSRGERDHKPISREQWEVLLEAARDVAKPVSAPADDAAVTASPPRQRLAAKGFSHAEQAAIDAALQDRRFMRIEQGSWPEHDRDELKKRWGWGGGR
jgi:transcriptional regulator with XRE-family HTH domain